VSAEVIRFPSERRDSEPWLRKAELARELQCSGKTIERRMREGMPFMPVGRHPRFRLSEVEAWLRQA
jgi:excisionase family DNA binding protein